MPKIEQERVYFEGRYGSEDRSQELHPDNKHVKDKTRQQLQMLRDEEVVEFLRKGSYLLRL
jgi:type II restriction enzyme